MNKNLKVISSLAMAGILAATGISTVSAATTKSLGVYRKIVEGKAVVPYVLEKASDKVDVKDLNSEFKVTLSSGTVVKTGTTFNKAGEPHTVVVYGDVKDDGKVNVNDVTTLVDAVANGTKLDEFKKEAADVRHDGKVNVNDITTLVGYIANGDALNISLPSEEEPETEYAYTVTVNENNIVNNVNCGTKTTQGQTTTYTGGSKLAITPTSGSFKGGETFTVELYAKNEDGTYATQATSIENVTIPAAEVNEKWVIAKDLYFGDVADGTYKLQVKDATTHKVVGEEKEVVVSKSINNIKANITATRIGVDSVSMSVEVPESAKIAKVYYKVGAYDNIQTISETAHAVTEAVTLHNVGGATVTIGYILEDVNGNRVNGTVVVQKHDAANSAISIGEITAVTGENKFKINLSADIGNDPTTNIIAVALYKDGKLVDVKNLTSNDKDTNDATGKTVIADFDGTISQEGVGTYTIKAYAIATANNKPSATVDSATTVEDTATGKTGKIVVSQLAKVSNVNVNLENNEITWEDATNKNVNYEVTVLRPKMVNGKFTGEYTAVNGETDNTNIPAVSLDTSYGTNGVNATTKTAKLALNNGKIDIKDNVSYKVEVKAVPAAASNTTLDSEGVTSDEFFTVKVPTFTMSTTSLEESVKLEGIEKAELKGNINATISYAVKVYDESNNQSVLVDTQTVTLTEPTTVSNVTTYSAVVKNLTEGKSYRFILAVTINGKTAESVKTPTAGNDAITIGKNPIAITGLKVVTTEPTTEGVKGVIYTDGTKAYINGEKVANINVFSTEYQAVIRDIVAPLSNGDKITVAGNNITLDLRESTIGRSTTTTFGAAIEGKTVEVTGNDFVRTFVMPTKVDNQTVDKVAEKLVLNAGGFAIAGTDGSNKTLAKEIVVNGSELTASTGSYTVKAGTATVNGITTTSTKDIKVTPTVNNSKDTISVVASDSNLTFETTKDLTVEFTGKATQSGSVTVEASSVATSDRPEIALSATGETNVTGNIIVNAENVTVDATNARLTKTKNITVNNNSTKSEVTTVTANLANPTDVQFTTSAAVNVQDILDAWDKEAKEFDLQNVTNFAITANKDQEVYDFISGLGISADANATILVGVNNTTGFTEITLTFAGNVSNYTIPTAYLK